MAGGEKGPAHGIDTGEVFAWSENFVI